MEALQNALRATSTAAFSGLKAPLLGCPQDNERLRAEITELNDTVFSKNFKAPSAWAEREIKYKMEKKQWEQQVRNMNIGRRRSKRTSMFSSQYESVVRHGVRVAGGPGRMSAPIAGAQRFW